MRISSTRTLLYRAARLLGDVQAIRKGPRAVVKHAARKATGRAYGWAIRRILR